MLSETEKSNRSTIPTGPPAGYFVVVPSDADAQAIDIARIAKIVKRSWKVWLTTSLLGAIAVAAISLTLPNVYRARTLIAPVQQGNGGAPAGLGGQIGSLAAIAGFDLGGSGSRKQEFLATLTSEQLARDFVVSENLMPVLFSENWDAANNRWREDKKPPTLEAGVRKLTMDVVFISENRANGLVTVTAEWYSPVLAAHWASRIVEMANEHIRADAKRRAESSIEYLNKELEKSNVVELRQSISRLIEQQVNDAMLANVQREYAFRTIDPAVPPDRKSGPKRAAMTAVGGGIGLIVGLLAVLLRRSLTSAGRPRE